MVELKSSLGIIVLALITSIIFSGCIGGVDCDNMDFDIETDPQGISFTNTGETDIQGLNIYTDGQELKGDIIGLQPGQTITPGETVHIELPRYDEVEVISEECPEVSESIEIDAVELPEME